MMLLFSTCPLVFICKDISKVTRVEKAANYRYSMKPFIFSEWSWLYLLAILGGSTILGT